MKFSRLSLLAPSLLVCAAFISIPALAQDIYSPQPNGGNANTYNETRLSNLEEQMRVLNGRVEQAEFAVRRMETTLQRLQQDDDARLTKLEQGQANMAAQASALAAAQPTAQPPVQQSAQPATVPIQQQAAPVEANGTLGAIKVQNGKVVGGVNAPSSTPLPNVPADYGATSAEQYDRALTLLRSANYPDAEAAFKSFIDKNPKDKMIDNARYWYGETLFVRGKFDEAAVTFADAYQQNPKGPKAPDNLLKLGLSLGALNRIPDACVTLNELKTKYPNAAANIKTRAQDERVRLKCPGR